MRLGWVYHDDFLLHGADGDHPERPDRLRAIVEGLTQEGLLAQMEPLSFTQPNPRELWGVHVPAYVSLVRLACMRGMPFLGCQETRLSPQTYDIAMLAVGGVLAACDAAIGGRVPRSFCAVRPPGHHAEPEVAGGFCLFNNVAVAADYLIRQYGVERVAILDFDVHHGNGTQKCFENRRDVLFASIHEHPANLYPGTGYEEERGVGEGEGYTINVAMPPGSDDAAYRQAFSEKILPRLYEYNPEFVLLSAGFDALGGDQIAHMNLEPESYSWMTEEMVKLAETCCKGRLVSVLEGGYELPLLKRAVTQHVRALMSGWGRARADASVQGEMAEQMLKAS